VQDASHRRPHAERATNSVNDSAVGRRANPLHPESDTRFFAKLADAQIDFVKNQRGIVTHLVVHRANEDVQATRRPN
jgi:hypothetical protein